MKHITECLSQQIGQAETIAPLSISPEAQSIVDLLFVAFEEHIKYFRLNHLSGNDNAKREWTKTFMQCGISKERVQRGIKRLRTNGVIYSTITPGEFLELCAIAPEDINAPSVDDAYLEACRNSHPSEVNKTWSHKAVRHAAHKTGSHFLRSESKSITLPQFKENYLESCQMYFDGRILDQLENDKPQLRRELEETKKTLSEGFEHLNSPKKALSALKDMLR